MAKTNDASPDMKDWTNRKLVATVRYMLHVAGEHSGEDRAKAHDALTEIERRFVRSSSRG